MNILLIGSGGREHALAYTLSKSSSMKKLYCVPGNPGIFKIAEEAKIDISNHEEIIEFCKNNSVSLVVVGPEQPLSNGIADSLRGEGIAVFGPGKSAAQLESSKKFAKEFMMRHNIPTAAYACFEAYESVAAHKHLDSCDLPIVLKADGLAAGKGVVVATTLKEAHETLDSFFEGLFDEAGKTVVIEEFMEGEEASILAVCDGTEFVTLASSQDHKRIYNEDKGANTGGMGAYSPAPIVTEGMLEKVRNRIIKPAIAGMKAEGNPFIGCLYVGLMIKAGEPKVVEFNVRFGDPETQAVLSVFEGDFAKLLLSAAYGELDTSYIRSISKGFACCVVLASEGYPDKFMKGLEITGIEDAEESGAFIYYAGTKMSEGKLITSGGRVLGVTGTGAYLKEAIDHAYTAVEQIKFDNVYFRQDIGQKGLVYLKY